jgi:hypothetical protein
MNNSLRILAILGIFVGFSVQLFSLTFDPPIVDVSDDVFQLTLTKKKSYSLFWR